MKPLVVAIVGATGSGKTALAERLASQFSGEIVSADSRQAYRGLDIGTAKEKNLAVPQHLIDWKDPGEPISVAEFQARAYQEIEAIQQRGKLPFLVGGSMLYAESVMNGYEFEEGEKSARQTPRYSVLKLGVAVDRPELRQRLAARCQMWLDQGLLEEITRLRDQGVSLDWLKSLGLEYRYFTLYIEGEISLAEATEKTVLKLGQYAKRQDTWWRRHSDIHWVADFAEASAAVKEFLSRPAVV